MKIITIVGARPQFIKVAAISRVLRKYHQEILIHTGQHYDYNMSGIFFEELSIPKPDYNLSISGNTHGAMTGKMLLEIENILINEKPELVLVYGDTNSTLAAGLAAVKLHIPLCHVEAGGRLGTLDNPEEVNRICTDHISSLLLCCTQSAVEFLKKEGKTKNVFLVGDPMLDAFIYYSNFKVQMNLMDFDNNQVKLPKDYYYLTCHRQENTNTDENLYEILKALNSLEFPCIYPVHPRTQAIANRVKAANCFNNIILCKPVGYLESIYLVNHAKKIVTDSGGLQREAFFARKQCVTVFNYIAWPETMQGKCNQISKPNSVEILKKLDSKISRKYFEGNDFGDGNSAQKIVNAIEKFRCEHII